MAKSKRGTQKKADDSPTGGDVDSATPPAPDGAVQRERSEREEAEGRAARAVERAREAEEAYRRVQLDLVAAKDALAAAEDRARDLDDKCAVLEAGVLKLREELAAATDRTSAPTPAGPEGSSALPPSAPELTALLQRLLGLRDVLATASNDLSQLHADEVALGRRRARVLSDACAILARAVGATGQEPPPLPSPALEARLSIAPVVDISEVADLIDSLRPPRPLKGD